jgi:hypothetical protein
MKHSLWSDDYWLLLMQLYLKKPMGVKPLYSKAMVDLALELHIPPQFLYEQMFKLRSIDTPRMEKLWYTYGENRQKLRRGVRLLRKKMGYGNASLFYDGVEVNESFEKDFKPIEEDGRFTPLMLILILDLYFRLTPLTMVDDTPEIIQLAKLMKIKPKWVVEIMNVYQCCDPYLKRKGGEKHALMDSCKRIWNRYGNDNPQKLAALAAQMKEYFK